MRLRPRRLRPPSVLSSDWVRLLRDARQGISDSGAYTQSAETWLQAATTAQRLARPEPSAQAPATPMGFIQEVAALSGWVVSLEGADLVLRDPGHQDTRPRGSQPMLPGLDLP